MSNKSLAIIGIAILIGIVIATFYPDNHQKINQVMNISATEFQQQNEQQPGIVIDVRTQEEYNEGHLAETDQHHDFLNGDFEAKLDSFDKNETYYLYCRSGNRSGQAAELMVENGFKHVYNIGGFEDLVAAGLGSEK